MRGWPAKVKSALLRPMRRDCPPAWILTDNLSISFRIIILPFVRIIEKREVLWELAWRDPIFWGMSARTRAHTPKYGPYHGNSWTQKELNMLGKQFREKLHAGDRLYGTLIVSSSPRWPALVSKTGVDFVFIDTEHNALDRETVSWMCQAYSALGLPPVVRIPRPDPYLACSTLDGGAQAIIAPYVETPEEVRLLVGAVKYRPLKGRKLKTALNGHTPLEPQLVEYLEQYNQHNSLIINIESQPALEALDEILAVPGLDGVLVGPHDLTTNSAIAEEYHNPVYIALVDEIVRKCRGRSIGVGVHVMYENGIDQEIRWARMGANLIVHMADYRLFQTGLSAALSEVKLALGDRPAAAANKEEIHI
jgi:2-keto-3-deoxy-L-rhamnonate aldolase RhmA